MIKTALPPGTRRVRVSFSCESGSSYCSSYLDDVSLRLRPRDNMPPPAAPAAPGHRMAVSVGLNGVGIYAYDASANTSFPLVLRAVGDLSAWTSVAITVENNVVRVFFNGSQAAQTTLPYDLRFDGVGLNAAASGPLSGAYGGLVADVRVYRRALAAENVAGIHRNAFAYSFYPGTKK